MVGFETHAFELGPHAEAGSQAPDFTELQQGLAGSGVLLSYLTAQSSGSHTPALPLDRWAPQSQRSGTAYPKPHS